MSNRVKPLINLVVIGHVDSGKSTLTGRCLLNAGAFDKRLFEKFEAESKQQGKGSFSFAWIFDGCKEERDRGVTINCNTKPFETDTRKIQVTDAPGHRDFIKNMITGTSQADAANLVVAASIGEFEAGIGETGCTLEHARLCSVFGLKQMIVSVNKMDMIDYSETRFNEIKEFMITNLKKIGVLPTSVAIVPVSAFNNENINTPTTKMPWWKGGVVKRGDKELKYTTLFEAFDTFVEPSRHTDKPLRAAIGSAYKIGGIGTVATARIDAGVMTPGMNLYICPAGLVAECKSIEMNHNALTKAMPGDNVGFNLKGVAVKDVKRGCVVGDSKNEPPKEVESFEGQIVVLSHPGKIGNGYKPVVDVHTAHVTCKFELITAKLDKKTFAKTEENPDFIKEGDGAIVKFKPEVPMTLEAFSNYPALGRFAIRDSNKTVAVGVVKSVTFKAK